MWGNSVVYLSCNPQVWGRSVVYLSCSPQSLLEVTPPHPCEQYDERLKEVRRKEREFMMMQKLKQRSEDLCNRCVWRGGVECDCVCGGGDPSFRPCIHTHAPHPSFCPCIRRLNADIARIKHQKVALQKHMEACAKQVWNRREGAEGKHKLSMVTKPTLFSMVAKPTLISLMHSVCLVARGAGEGAGPA